jgi:HPt (histidine-containing phosphotransfer) domain-containing protein
MRWLTGSFHFGHLQGVTEMGRKIISTRPSSHSSETIAGDEAFPRPSAGDCGNALPSLSGRADAKQPGETASRLLRIVPAKPETIICWKDFAVLQSLLSPADFAATVSLHLLHIDLHLLQIASSRTRRDYEAVAREAHAIGRIAGNLGASSAKAAAHLLEQSCQVGDHGATYGLISALSRACDGAGADLHKWLAQNPAMLRS